MSETWDDIFKDSPTDSAELESDNSYCSMHPQCEWGHGCKGNHSFSPQHSEETVEHAKEDVPKFDDEVESSKPPLVSHDDCDPSCEPIESLDDTVVLHSEELNTCAASCMTPC